MTHNAFPERKAEDRKITQTFKIVEICVSFCPLNVVNSEDLISAEGLDS